VIQKLASVSSVVSSTVGVPNSLGPGELLVHYGTQEQKDQYLPRLADGREVPCFGLTGPFAGSDATSIPDYGIVCKGEWNGEQVLGVADLRQALHHAGAGRFADRPGLPHVRPGWPDRRHPRHRHHPGAAAA
jgi:alkylation response protein AidB-like acyl-CoA dehydrogenase